MNKSQGTVKVRTESVGLLEDRGTMGVKLLGWRELEAVWKALEQLYSDEGASLNTGLTLSWSRSAWQIMSSQIFADGAKQCSL